MIGKRTNVDFSKHSLSIKEDKFTKIYEFAIPNTIHSKITFINTCGILSVTGDYGNYIFCREFHPDKGTKVSDGYWIEKLVNSSYQVAREYNSELTKESILEKLSELEYYTNDIEKRNKLEEYFNDCLRCIDDELEYKYYAFREYPSFFDCEDIPFEKSIKIQLQVIFDAFDIMCEII